MIERPKARPVSGEIMTNAADMPAFASARPDFTDVVDADYEIVGGDAPKRESRTESRISNPPETSAAGMDILRFDQAVQPARRRGGAMFWSVAIGLIFATFWVSGGHAYFRNALPVESASPVATLRISNISSRIEDTGTAGVLYIDGEAVNETADSLKRPPLEIRIVGNDGAITRHKLGTAGTMMTPGEKFAFSSRLGVPKTGVRTVSAAFIE
ncbi:hypothetical protein [Foliimonas ilicis]|uniref:hypothetical protein n=1 Tax=Mesorhizobium sp. SB112 TaxID=3151853 RepID=UPI003264C325